MFSLLLLAYAGGGTRWAHQTQEDEGEVDSIGSGLLPAPVCGDDCLLHLAVPATQDTQWYVLT